MSRLLIVAADGSKRAVTLSDNTIRIGRSAGNDVVLPDAAKGVSRTHAELRYDNGRFLIVDLNSQNGTWLNGRRIEQAEVARDSEIVLGTYHLRLQDTWEDDTVPIPLDGIAMETPRPRLAPAAPTAELDEIVLVRSQAAQPNKRRGGRGSSYSRKLILAGAIAIMCLAALAWVFGFNRSQEGSLDVAAAPSTSHAEASSTPPSPQASAPNAVTPRLVSNATQPPATGDASPVVRLAETTDTTTARHTAELAARYANARTALERGDFGAAARAFDAIVGEDASYREASQLLSRARTAQRAGGSMQRASGSARCRNTTRRTECTPTCLDSPRLRGRFAASSESQALRRSRTRGNSTRWVSPLTQSKSTKKPCSGCRPRIPIA